MGKHKNSKKKKGSQFAIRVDKDERDAFVSLCEALDTSAAREIRRFMREWVIANSPVAAQEDETSLTEAADVAVSADAGNSDPTVAEAEGSDPVTTPREETSEGTNSDKPKKRKKGTS